MMHAMDSESRNQEHAAHEEDMGGDAACWAHQFEDETGDAGDRRVTNLIAHARNGFTRGPVWTAQSDDLNVNLLVFHRGQAVEEHVNSEVDVLLVGVDGEGVVSIDGEPYALPPGHTVIVPKGAQHTFANPGSTRMRMVGTFSPARFEHYFDELAAEIAKHQGQRPDPSVIAALYAKYESELVT